MNVANIILAQLGGSRFVVMTGAKQLVAGENSLTFKLPSNFATNGINCVRITLDPSDTYTVEFLKLRGMTVKTISKHEDVYNDVLRSLFTSATGLHTSL